jgi:MFS transporter, DHA1 family, multidrug resistance protein
VVEKIKRAVPALFILVFMVSIGPFGDTEYTPSLPRIAQEFGVHYSLVQLTMTSYLFGYAISQLFYGPISDKFGRKPIMLVGAMIFVVGSLVCYTSYDIWQLISGRFIQSLGSCAGGVIASAAVRDAFPANLREHVFAKVYAAFALAPAIGPVVGGFVDTMYGWHPNFLILLILAVLLFFAVLFFFPETNFNRNPDALKPRLLLRNYGSLMLDPYYLPNLIIMGCAIGIVYVALIDAPNLVVNVLHMTSIAIVIIAASVLLGFVAGALLCNYLAGKVVERKLVLLGILLMLGGSLLLGAEALLGWMALSLWFTMPPVMIIFSGIAFIIPLCTADALLPFQRVTGSASAMLGFFQMGIASLSTGLLSIIHRSAVFDMPVMFTSLALIAFIVFVCFIWARPNRKRYAL